MSYQGKFVHRQGTEGRKHKSTPNAISMLASTYCERCLWVCISGVSRARVEQPRAVPPLPKRRTHRFKNVCAFNGRLIWPYPLEAVRFQPPKWFQPKPSFAAKKLVGIELVDRLKSISSKGGSVLRAG
jgi:hypothetical protein